MSQSAASATGSRPSTTVTHVCWPDADPIVSSTILADDVTGLNATPVGRIIMCRCLRDVQDALALARTTGVCVSIRGTQHSMGGQSISPGGIVIDLKGLNCVTFGPEQREKGIVVTETGAMWSDLISALNPWGFSPRTMQSYSSFSVGGTLSVNGHGITTDYCMIESVLAFTLVRYDGTVTEVTKDDELFGLCIGGYGMFGIMTSVTMKVSPNTSLDLEAIVIPITQFAQLYEKVRGDEEIDIKLARVDITTMDTATLYLFRRTHDKSMRTVSHLSLQPREMGFVQQMMYKWMAPTMKELRFGVEQTTGVALDWSEASDRNTLMFESAVPLARLSSPYLDVDDTFVLQEYFVPMEKFNTWTRAVRPIYCDLKGYDNVTVLNTTIRYVKHDTQCFLRYAKSPQGMFAFVLYYRVHRTAQADAKLHDIHTRFVKETLRMEGTFYLPYRHHYTHEDMLTAYPQMPQFFAFKEKYDPEGIFDSAWFRRYGIPLCSEKYQTVVQDRIQKVSNVPREKLFAVLPKKEGAKENDVPRVSDRRTHSYQTMFRHTAMRRAFHQLFLTKVFNVRSNTEVYNTILQALYLLGPAADDDAVYAEIHRSFGEQSALGSAMQAWKSLTQLQEQKVEFATEYSRILHKLGKVGLLSDYVSIGDHGKMVTRLRAKIGMKGKTWIVHDSHDDDDITAAIERGSADSIGTFVPIDYIDSTMGVIPNASADLVTMNQGLHHIPQDKLGTFLGEVKRVLREGGLFFIREHDANEELIPMLDLAHSVYNAVTGVHPRDDRKEIRAFRPVLAWRDLVESFGFVDARVYEMQSTDPTEDVMMCFFKPPFKVEAAVPNVTKPKVTPAATASSIPSYLMQNGAQFVDGLSSFIVTTRDFLVEASPDKTIARNLLSSPTDTAVKMLDRLKPILAHAVAAQTADSAGGGDSDGLIPPELYEGYLALKRRVEKGKATPGQIFLHSGIEYIRKAITEQGDDGTEAEGQVVPISIEGRPTGDQIYAELQALCTDIPNMDKSDFWENAGVSRQLQNAAISEGGTMKDLSDWLATKLDATAWKRFRAAVVDIRASKLPPHYDLVINKRSPGNPWWTAAVALMGSPAMKLSQSARWYASLGGYADLVNLFDVAQAARVSDDFLTRQDSTTPEALEAATDQALNAIQGMRRECVMKGKLQSIHDISHVISVEYQGQDVTTTIVEKFLSGTTLQLDGVNLDKEFRYSSIWNTRTAQLFTGQGIVRICYISTAPSQLTSVMPAIETVLGNLTLLGHRRPQAKAAPQFTFYKLPEWMQVEICKVFAASLDHTPWYRFPFMTVMAKYFEVLQQEFRYVRRQYGLPRALFSSAFGTSLVPGLVMGLLFAQVQILAIPLKLKLGESYENTGPAQTERIIFTMPLNEDPLEKIPHTHFMEHFGDAPRMLRPRVYAIDSPVFLHFTECLKTLATIPSLQIIDISQQPVIQVKVAIRGAKSGNPVMSSSPVSSFAAAGGSPGVPLTASAIWTEKIKKFGGCEVVLTYQYPQAAVSSKESEAESTFVAVAVKTPYIMAFLRYCEKHREALEVVQVFDFWG